MVARALKILNLVLLLVVYVSFFAVQLLFNGGAHTQPQFHSYRYLQQSHKDEGKKDTISVDNTTKSIKKNIRLNKRFQPVSMPSMAYTVIAPFSVYITTVAVSKPVSYLLISSILVGSLRGPPVTA